MGNAEKLLGQCTKNHANILISTKYHPEKQKKNGEVLNALRNSMNRLSIEHVYLYWIHRPYHIRENMHEMAMCVQQGFIQEIGLCNCNISQIKDAQEELSRYGTNTNCLGYCQTGNSNCRLNKTKSRRISAKRSHSNLKIRRNITF